MKKTLSILLMLNLLGVPALAQVPADTRSAEQQAYDAETERIRAALAEMHRVQRETGTGVPVTAYPTAPQTVSKEQRRKAFGAVTVVGLLMTIGGAVMFVPDGEDFDVFGDKFCVTNEYRTYTDGACSTSDGMKRAATAVLLLGATFLTVGAVGMKANASRTGFSAGATVKW